MFRLWGKIFKDNRMLKDTVICDDTDDTRTHKIFHALDEICYQFDLSKPIWLDSTIAEFKKHDKARFYQDNFVDSIDFDYLEIHIIESHIPNYHFSNCYSFRIAASGLNFIARRAGKYPAAIPTRIANASEISTSQGGM